MKLTDQGTWDEIDDYEIKRHKNDKHKNAGHKKARHENDGHKIEGREGCSLKIDYITMQCEIFFKTVAELKS